MSNPGTPNQPTKGNQRAVKWKITAGYLLILICAILSVRYVYREMVRSSSLDDYESQLYTKYSYISRTLYHLYRAENYGQFMFAGYLSYDQAYRQEMDSVRIYIDSLGMFGVEATDSLQRQRLDSITTLLAVQEQNMLILRSNVHSAAAGQFYDENIDSLLTASRIVSDTTTQMLLSPSPEDSLSASPIKSPSPPGEPEISQLEEKVSQQSQTAYVRHDTIVTTRKKRPGFFRRLANAFSPVELDSTVVINTHVSQVTPQPPAIPIPTISPDTIITLLRNLQESVDMRRQQIYDKAWEAGNRLQRSNRLVTEKIGRLIHDFEQEWTGLTLERLTGQKKAQRHTITVIGNAAILGIFLTLIFLIIIWRDINRSNRQKRELEAANRYAAELLKIREQLMLTITHDIKAPLGAIMGQLELLSQMVTDTHQQHCLCNMQLSAHHLLRLVNDMLDFHRLESHKMDLNDVAFNPAHLFTEILSGYEPATRKKGLSLEEKLSPTLERIMIGDPVRIRQVADNLLSNALKFTDHGSISLQADLKGDRLRFSVSDTGRGIGPQEQEKIYQEFVRLPSAQGVEGFGLGLSITHKLVELLGGSISLHSVLGKGSTFEVELPLHPSTTESQVSEIPAMSGSHLSEAVSGVPSSEPTAAETVLTTATPPLQGIRCLLIDDDRFQLEITQAMCRRLGMEADCCQHPEQELESRITSHAYDVILTDIQMPAMDGYEVLRHIHTLDALLPVIAVTARSDNRREDFLAEGFAASLNKPFSQRDLTECIRPLVCSKGKPLCPLAEERGATASPKQDETAGDMFAPLTVFAGDDTFAAEEILRSFIEQTRENLDRLHTVLVEREMAALQAIAHKMLPMFRLLEASETVSLLTKMEHAQGEMTEEIIQNGEKVAAQAEEIVKKAEKRITLSENPKKR